MIVRQTPLISLLSLAYDDGQAGLENQIFKSWAHDLYELGYRRGSSACTVGDQDSEFKCMTNFSKADDHASQPTNLSADSGHD